MSPAVHTLRLPRGVRAALLAFAALGAMVGCNVSLEPPHRDEEPARLALSLAEGSTVRPGGLIDISVVLPEPSADAGASPPFPPASGEEDGAATNSVEVGLAFADGSIVTSRVFAHRAGDVFPSLTLDDLGLATGAYRLTVRLREGERLLEERTVDFYYVGQEYEISEITSDAPSVHPGSTVGLAALLEVPEGADPILEWSYGGASFARGTLGEGTQSVEWVSPAAEGIYSVTVAMYPLGSMPACIALTADVYVAVVADPTGELGPPSSYRGLYHLLGDLADASGALGSGQFLEGEPPALLTRGRLVGYRLEGESGLSIADFLLPAGSTSLDPFTITIGYTPAAAPPQGTLLRTASADGTLELLLSFEGLGPSLAAELRHPGGVLRLEADASSLAPDARSALSFSLSPTPPRAAAGADPAAADQAERTITAQWFVDGLPAGAAEWPAPPPPTGPGGVTTVGGPGGAAGLVDELGVYVRDAQGAPSTDAGLYARRIAGLHGPTAVADGFDGMALAATYAAQGQVAVRAGHLEIGSGSALTLPAFRLGKGGARVLLTLAAAPDPASAIELAWSDAEDGSTLLSLSGAGELAVGELRETVRLSAAREIELDLRPEVGRTRIHVEGILRAGSAPATFLVPGEAADTRAFVVRLAGGSEAAAPLLLESWAAWQRE